MNKEEYSRSDINRKNIEYKQVHNLLKNWKIENNIPADKRCVVHHRDDTEECRKYNNMYYERWGYNEDGSFEYGKYVVFMTLSEHARYHCTGEKNYNYGKHLSEETRQKMSESRKGEKNHFYGKHHSEETKKRISAANAGSNHPMYGKHRTEETKKKLSIANLGSKNPMYGKHMTDEAKAKISIATAGSNNPFYGKQHSDEVKAKISKYQKAIYMLWNVYKSNNGTKSYREFRVAIKSGDIIFEMQPITVFTR